MLNMLIVWWTLRKRYLFSYAENLLLTILRFRTSWRGENVKTNQNIYTFPVLILMGGCHCYLSLSLILIYLISNMLRINDTKEDLIALILPNMPEELRSTLLSKLRLIYPSLQTVDSQAEGFDNTFSSFHFSYYNRYSNRVSDWSLSTGNLPDFAC